MKKRIKIEGGSTSEESPRSTGMSTQTEEISLLWSAQSNDLKRALNNMYKDLSEQTLTDVTLASSEGEIVEAHSTVLAMISPYFQRLFSKVQRSKKAANGMVIIVGNVKNKTLRNLLRFVYTGKVNVSSNDRNELLAIAKIFEIPGLITACGSQPSATSSSSLYHTNECSVNQDNFDDFQTAVSEDERGYTSEPEVKYHSSEYSTQDKAGNFSDSDFNPGNDEGQSDDSSYDRKQSSKKRRTAITLKRQSNPKVPDQEKTIIQQRVNPRTGAVATYKGAQHNWIPLPEPMTDEQIADAWKVWYRKDRKRASTTTFYCAKAEKRSKCPVLIRKVTYKDDGGTEFFVNDAEHSTHRADRPGLSVAEKEFVKKICEEKNFPTPTEILRCFKLAGKPEPVKRKLEAYLFGLRAQKRLKKVKLGRGRPPKEKDAVVRKQISRQSNKNEVQQSVLDADQSLFAGTSATTSGITAQEQYSAHNIDIQGGESHFEFDDGKQSQVWTPF